MRHPAVFSVHHSTCKLWQVFRTSITGVELVADDSKVVPNSLHTALTSFRFNSAVWVQNKVRVQFCVSFLNIFKVQDIATKAISFWTFQKDMEVEYQKSESKKVSANLQQMEKAFNDKMLEAANQINIYKHKAASIKWPHFLLSIDDVMRSVKNSRTTRRNSMNSEKSTLRNAE